MISEKKGDDPFIHLFAVSNIFIKYIPRTVFFNFSFVHVVLNFIVELILITSPEFNTIKNYILGLSILKGR